MSPRLAGTRLPQFFDKFRSCQRVRKAGLPDHHCRL